MGRVSCTNTYYIVYIYIYTRTCVVSWIRKRKVAVVVIRMQPGVATFLSSSNRVGSSFTRSSNPAAVAVARLLLLTAFQLDTNKIDLGSLLYSLPKLL